MNSSIPLILFPILPIIIFIQTKVEDFGAGHKLGFFACCCFFQPLHDDLRCQLSPLPLFPHPEGRRSLRQKVCTITLVFAMFTNLFAQILFPNVLNSLTSPSLFSLLSYSLFVWFRIVGPFDFCLLHLAFPRNLSN